MLRYLLVAALCGATGCTLIFNVDDLRDDGTIDAAAPDAIPVDADPANLRIDNIDPMTIDEGVGADNGRPALFIANGDSIVGATVTLALDPDGANTPITPDATAVSMNRLSFAARIPVLDTCNAGSTLVLRATISQPGAPDATQDITVTCLDELDPSTANVATGNLEPIYSRITIDAPVHFTGTLPARLHATAGATITAAIDANAAGLTAGAGGCPGGGPAEQGECVPAGGGAGGPGGTLLSGFGGGGGGFGLAGSQAGGDGGGAAGPASGNPMLVPLGSAGNAGNGGGGAGAGTLGDGGAGGPAGGTIEIAAGGDMTLASTIMVAGATGTAANGAGGGGGSGGAILIRAGSTLTATGANLSAAGAAGASASTSPGGNGNVGRIRVDRATGTIIASPSAVRGPSWALDTPLIVDGAQVTMTLFGQPTRDFGIFQNDNPVADVRPGPSGSQEFPISLVAGRNRICAAYTSKDDPDLNLDDDAALICVDVLRR